MKKADYLKKKQCQHVSADGRMIGTPTKWRNPRLGKIFRAMKQRCYNKNNQDYPSYGQRGIRICEEWLERPQSFEEWALAHEYRGDLTIDRKDSDGNYEPGNCRWIPRSENTKYKGSTQIFRVGKSNTPGENGPLFVVLAAIPSIISPELMGPRLPRSLFKRGWNTLRSH